MFSRKEYNVSQLLLQREIYPRSENSSRGAVCTCHAECSTSPNCELGRWAESDFFRRCSAKYLVLGPHSRSTIAAAFSHNGELLASTHGDHTVKVINCATGRCTRTLTGHMRTPWVVRFHPRNERLLASGSLDHQVRLWDLATGESINHWDFGRPIASLAFHSEGNILAVASGHKLYIWEHNKGAVESGVPSICLRTRRSLRAVHFHPHGAPLILTAEVNEPDQHDYLPSLAQRAGAASQHDERQHRESVDRDTGTASVAAPFGQAARRSGSGGMYLAREADSEGSSASLGRLSGSHSGALPSGGTDGMLRDNAGGGRQSQRQGSSRLAPPAAAGAEGSSLRRAQEAHASERDGSLDAPAGASVAMEDAAETDSEVQQSASNASEESHGPWQQRGPAMDRRDTRLEANESWQEASRPLPPTMVPMGWELPADMLQRDIIQHQQASERLRVRARSSSLSEPPEAAGMDRTNSGTQSSSAEAVAAATAAAAAIVGQERPCTVKLKLWGFDAGAPRRVLDSPCLTIPHTVLCSEMGVHFSPCGRYLAACVACKPQPSEDSESAGGNATASPIYELRVISLEKPSFGTVLKAAEIRAAHCLTSIQFSPTSTHLLLAYGRRHISLLRSLVADGGSIIPVHTILEVYRVCDMSLVRVLPSAEDEVNVATFHPFKGGGVAYGTKEGRLRILRHDRAPFRPEHAATAHAGRSLEDELLEADQMVESVSSESDGEVAA
mmetsp:Transcript_7806/g.18684  ORF Transcript_7806/g.18684 Transcript_7806/m.18684 type:complete len:729 (+) Transcript_7806:188-2374(+)